MNNEGDLSIKDLFIPLTTKKAIIFIIIIGITVFFNSLFNGFVGDDEGQFITNNLTHSISNLPMLFHSVLQGTGGSFSYRPIPFVIVTVLNSFLGSSPFNFHLLQVLIHIANCTMIYILLKNMLEICLPFLPLSYSLCTLLIPKQYRIFRICRIYYLFFGDWLHFISQFPNCHH